MNSILIALNIMRRLLREVSAFGFIFLFPILAAVLATLMFGGSSVPVVAIAGVPADDYGLISYLELHKDYDIRLMDAKELEAAIEDNKAAMGLILPDQLHGSDRIKLISEKDGEAVHRLRGLIDGYIGAAVANAPLPKAEQAEKSNDAAQKPKAAIGMVSMFIIMFIGTGLQLLLEDKRQKTFMRSLCAPMHDFELMLGHLIANFILGLVQILIFLSATALVFKFDFGTSMLNVFVLLAVFLLTAIGLGLAVVSFVSDSGRFNMIMTITAVSMSFLGGCFFPLEYMNDFIKKLANITPQKWLMDAFVKLSGGQGIANAQIELLIILLFGVVLFTFGAKTMRPSPEDL